MIGVFIYDPLAASSTNTTNLFLLLVFSMIIVNIGGATNALILFLNSCDYQKAYKKEFSKIKHHLFKCLNIKQQTSTILIQPRIQNQITKVVNPA
ncbi:unnamed protein product [Meloidogyne enterolobii]|uniref:Uncharacterized protein n=1 Tax=Meloidogyne enterolobii TaxID=390850 RepID=A0ACB0Y6A2_MELEN